VAVLLGLTAALAYGASDFIGGLLSRRFSFLQVAVVGQLVAAAGMLTALPFTSPATAPVATLAWGTASGAGAAFGSLALYRGLGRGQMAVVAPLSGVAAAALPALAGLLLGERPSPLALTGVVLALPAVWLVSAAGEANAEPTNRRSSGAVADGLLSGVGFAVLFLGLDRAGGASGLWPVAAAQVSSAVLLCGTALSAGRPLRPERGLVAGAASVGVLGGTATVLFFFATGMSLVAVAAVLTSLYPAATVLLARLLLAERLSRTQLLGLGLAAAAVVLIVTG